MSDGGAGVIGGLLEVSVGLAKYPAGRAALLGAAGLLALSGATASRSDTRAIAFLLAAALVLIVLPFFARSMWRRHRAKAKRRARIRDLLVLAGIGAVAVVAGVILASRRSKAPTTPMPSASEIDALAEAESTPGAEARS